MKKILNKLRKISRTQWVIGLVTVIIVGGGITWGIYDQQKRSNIGGQLSTDTRSEEELAEQKARQLEIASGTSSHNQTTESGSLGGTSSSNSSSPATHTPSTQSNSGANSSVSSPTTQSGSTSNNTSPTSPSYQGDNGDTPQVALTNPSFWKQTVSGSFTATASASDSSGINRVVFMIRKIGQATAVQTVADTTAPYSAVLDVSGLPNGDSDYTVEAQAFDNTGKGNLASYRIAIQN